MKLSELRWYPYRIPFRTPFVTARGPLNFRSGALVRVQTAEGYTGYGEIAPLPEFHGISLDQALHALPRLAREFHGRELADIRHFLEIAVRDDLMGKTHGQADDGRTILPAPLLYGLETALLDVLGQARGQSLATLLAEERADGQMYQQPAVPRSSIPVNAVIGWGTTGSMVARAQEAIAAGFTCLKLKITASSQEEIEKRVAALRAAIGPAPRLRLDANEGWDFVQARSILASCAAYDIQYVEQPLPAHDLLGMARLREVSPVLLAADEALVSLAAARHILNAEAADILILKPQLVGGLYACRRVIQEAGQRQVDCVLTSTLETGIGVTAALHLAAASPEITLACGLATLNLLEQTLLQSKLSLRGGCLPVPANPGLGVQIEKEALKSYAS